MQEDSFKYYAFISYSHKDAKWARWIHGALEHYRLPAIMRKAEKNRYPKRIAPVFLDSTDLGVGDLGKTLPEELAKSRYLIVLCSPNSANPNEQGKNYIDQEVTWFCDEGRDDNVIPVIIEGTPNDAFCQSLKKREILAVDATKQSKARVLNDIVAKLLGLAPDELWKRELRRIRQRIIVHGAVAMAVSSIVCCLAWLFADRYCEHIEHYADYVNDWGVPRGIKPLSGKALSHRSGYYKFTYRGYAAHDGKRQRVLRTVSYCDAAGLVSDAAQHVWFTRPPRQDLYYENGKLIRRVARNEDGIEMYSLNVSDEGVWSRSSNGPIDANWIWGGTIAGYKDVLKGLGFDVNISHLLPEFRTLASVPSFYISEETEAGLPARIDFLPNNRARFSMPNGLGAYGEKYSYDEIGRLTRVRFLGKDGNPFVETNVFAGLDVSYSSLTTTVVSVDARGKPIANTFGWVIKQFVHSSSGNLETIRYLDENMKLVSGPLGVAVLQMEYDEENRHELRSLRYDSQNKFISDNVGWAISETKWQGKVKHTYYKKATGDEYVTGDGYSHIAIERTPSRRIERYYLGNDVPVRHAKSLAHKRVLTIERTGADGEDLIVQASFYDEKQQPAISRDLSVGNISNMTFRMSRIGIEEMTFLPAARAICARIKIDRTARFGKIVKSRLSILDANGDPMVPRPMENFTHDELTRAKQNDAMAASVNLSKMPSDDFDCAEISLDEMGRVESVSKLRNGKLSDNAFGIAQTKISYGENGLISRILLDNENGVASSNVFGIAAIDLQYDRKGLTDMIFLGVDMKPVRAKFFDAARMSFEYDRYGHVTWTKVYNEKNELTVSSQLGGAVIHQEYSPLGEPLLFECFDENMQRIPKVGTSIYAAKYSYQRLHDTRVVIERFFGKDGVTPVAPSEPGYHMMRKVLNLRGQLMDQSTYDVDCKTLRSDKDGGLARMCMQYDSNGQPERLRWYDCSNMLVMEQVDVDRNGCVDVPIRVLGDTYGRWGLQDLDVVVSVNGVFCLGDVELVEACMKQPKVSKKIIVARVGEIFGQQFIERKECVIPAEVDGIPVRFDVTYVPLGVFVKIREVACPMQQKMNAALAAPLSM